MNAQQLAQAAADSAAGLRFALNSETLAQVEQGFIARWIDTQDESISPVRVIATAKAALHILRNRVDFLID